VRFRKEKFRECSWHNSNELSLIPITETEAFIKIQLNTLSYVILLLLYYIVIYHIFTMLLYILLQSPTFSASYRAIVRETNNYIRRHQILAFACKLQRHDIYMVYV